MGKHVNEVIFSNNLSAAKQSVKKDGDEKIEEGIFVIFIP